MDTESLDNYRALNEQLSALVEAGVPLDVGLGSTDLPAAKVIERINAIVARRVGRGESLIQALQGDERDVPTSYRSFVQLGLHSGSNLAAGFDGSTRVAEAVNRSDFVIETALIYPLIVCVLVYAGMIGLCLFFVPTLADMYESLRLTPGAGLWFLELLRTTLPYWAAILPILFLISAVWRIRARKRRRLSGAFSAGLSGRLPGVSKSIFQERCACFADSLARLLDDGVPLEDALRISAGTCEHSLLRENAERLATALDAGQMPNDDSPTALRLPPFLRWAIWHSDSSTGRPDALRIAARVYRDASERRVERLQTIAPIVSLVLLGGTVTLLYGLALFVPLVELLCALAA